MQIVWRVVLVLLLLEQLLLMSFCTCSDEHILFREQVDKACGDLVMHNHLAVFANDEKKEAKVK